MQPLLAGIFIGFSALNNATNLFSLGVHSAVTTSCGEHEAKLTGIMIHHFSV